MSGLNVVSGDASFQNINVDGSCNLKELTIDGLNVNDLITTTASSTALALNDMSLDTLTINTDLDINNSTSNRGNFNCYGNATFHTGITSMNN